MRLPKKYRFEGQEEVLVYRQGNRVILEPKKRTWDGKLRANLEKKGRLIGPNDMLIAAHALSLGLVLVTDNVREFRHVKGLKVENWRK